MGVKCVLQQRKIELGSIQANLTYASPWGLIGWMPPRVQMQLADIIVRPLSSLKSHLEEIPEGKCYTHLQEGETRKLYVTPCESDGNLPPGQACERQTGIHQGKIVPN